MDWPFSYGRWLALRSAMIGRACELSEGALFGRYGGFGHQQWIGRALKVCSLGFCGILWYVLFSFPCHLHPFAGIIYLILLIYIYIIMVLLNVHQSWYMLIPGELLPLGFIYWCPR